MANAMITRSARPPQLITTTWPWLAQSYAAIGLHERAAQITTMIDKRTHLDADTTTLSADLEEAQIRLVYQVLNGETTLLDAAIELDQAERVAAAAGAVPRLRQMCDVQVSYDLSKSLWQTGDGLLVELDQCVQHAADRIVVSMKEIGVVVDDASAGRAPALQHEAWLRMSNDVELIHIGWSIAHRLRISEFVPVVVDRYSPESDEWCWRHLELRVPLVKGMHAVLGMARDIANGAEPGVLTADEIVAALCGPKQRAG